MSEPPEDKAEEQTEQPIPPQSIQEILVKNALHVGSRIKVKHMSRFIFKLRPDGIYLIDIKRTVERLAIAAKFISLFPPEKVVIVSSHVYGRQPVLKFCELTHTTPVVGKFPPGMFTNRNLEVFMEPKLVLVTDPRYDSQAVTEASTARIPVAAMCSTDNVHENIDLIIPMNNRGKTSLAYAFWYLARLVLIEKGELPSEAEMPVPPEDFMTIEAPSRSE